MFATDAETIHEATRHSFLLYPVVVVPAQDMPRIYEGLNDEICVPTTRAILFDQGAASYKRVDSAISVVFNSQRK